MTEAFKGRRPSTSVNKSLFKTVAAARIPKPRKPRATAACRGSTLTWRPLWTCKKVTLILGALNVSGSAAFVLDEDWGTATARCRSRLALRFRGWADAYLAHEIDDVGAAVKDRGDDESDASQASFGCGLGVLRSRRNRSRNPGSDEVPSWKESAPCRVTRALAFNANAASPASSAGGRRGGAPRPAC